MKIRPHIVIAFFLFLMVGCDNKLIPLKYAYQQEAYEFKTNSSKDRAWDQLIDLLTKNGLAIKTINKADGLITTETTSFLDSYTWENRHGTIMSPNAIVVCSRYRGMLTVGQSFKPNTLTGQWIVRLKEEEGKTAVMVKLANASGEVFVTGSDAHQPGEPASPYALQVRSTGVFERSIEHSLN